jgi:hypothetical protein
MGGTKKEVEKGPYERHSLRQKKNYGNPNIFTMQTL